MVHVTVQDNIWPQADATWPDWITAKKHKYFCKLLATLRTNVLKQKEENLEPLSCSASHSTSSFKYCEHFCSCSIPSLCCGASGTMPAMLPFLSCDRRQMQLVAA